MKLNINKIILTALLFSTSLSFAAFDGNYTFKLESASQAEINSIASPQNGMMVYNTDDNKIYYYNGSSWSATANNNIYNSNGQLSANREVDLNTYNIGFMNGNMGVGDVTPDATLDVAGSFRLDGIYYDKDGDAGTAGQILSSTTTGTDWIGSTSIPYVSSSFEYMNISSTKSFTITGNNFISTSIVTIPGFDGTIDSTNIISPTEINITVTSGVATADYDIIITNNGVTNTTWTGNGINLLKVAILTWKDLRIGGDVFTSGNAAGNDIRYRAGMNMTRDANGMYFTGLNPWGSWAKFESLGWTRGTNKTIQWIFTRPYNFMMIGIGSDATNEGSNSQWREAEVQVYFNNSTNMWGLYGNTGTPGNQGNQSNGVALDSCASDVFKLKFINDGTVGAQFTLYCLPSAAQNDWDNETTVMTTFAVGGTLNPNEANIMPFIIPRSGGAQKFIAVKVE